MTDPDLLSRVHLLVTTIAGPDRVPDHASPDTVLGDAGYGLDSLDVLEVILACEAEFSVVFDPADAVTADPMLSARGLADVIERRLRA